VGLSPTSPSSTPARLGLPSLMEEEEETEAAEGDALPSPAELPLARRLLLSPAAPPCARQATPDDEQPTPVKEPVPEADDFAQHLTAQVRTNPLMARSSSAGGVDGWGAWCAD
jgi:hypothetical protein